MPSHARNKTDYAFVRSKRTGEVDIRREKKFPRRSTSSLPSHERVLHYVGGKRTYVCRCSNAGRHFERTFSISSESRHLCASLALYLDRHNLESCAIADFREYRKLQEAKWEMKGVYVGDFHYASRNKNVICRCSQSRNHSLPRNPKIVEQCAEFFCLYKGELMVTKNQWKGFEGDAPPAYTSGVKIRPNHKPEMSLGSSRNSKEKTQSPVLPEIEMRRIAKHIGPVVPSPYHGASTQEYQPDLPPQVWQSARPSLCKAQFGPSSTLSTPMGSVPPSPPWGPSVLPNMTQRASTSSSWSQNQSEARVIDYRLSSDASRNRDLRGDSALDMSSMKLAVESMTAGVLPKSLPNRQDIKDQATNSVPLRYEDNAELPAPVAGAMIGVSISNNFDDKATEVHEKEGDEPISSSRSSPFYYDHWCHRRDQAYEKDNDKLLPSSLYVNRDMPFPFGFDDHDMTTRTPVAELPTNESPVELAVTHARQRHTATLKELEGQDWDMTSELEATLPDGVTSRTA